jgi:polyvinyl alcohol dehydrogenase (cytochrome)
MHMRWVWIVVIVAACAEAPTTEQIGSYERTNGDDWPMYGSDLHHTFARTDSQITAANAASLQPLWSFPTDDAVSASPTIVGGVVYVGGWDGYFYALDARTGALRWRFAVDCQNTIAPVPPRCLGPDEIPPERFDTDGGLITSSAAVVDGVVYFAGGRTVYALDADDGSLLWKRVTCGNPDAADCESDANDPTRVFSSPIVIDNKILLGRSVDGAVGYRGGIMALRTRDGSTAWSFEVDPITDSHGRVIGGYNRGYGNVWSSAAIDERGRIAVFGVADCQNDANPPYNESVLALSVDSGQVRWDFRPRTSDVCDFDFGATANVLDIAGERVFGVGGKDGTYYALRSRDGASVWSTNVVFGGNAGGFIGSTAFDGQRIYGATALGDFTGCKPDDPRDQPIQDPSFHAFGLDGSVAWEGFNAYSFGATTAASGVVFSGFIGLSADDPPALRVYDAGTGATVAELPQPGAVNSSATVTARAVYFGTGNSFDGAGGGVQAYALP